MTAKTATRAAFAAMLMAGAMTCAPALAQTPQNITGAAPDAPREPPSNDDAKVSVDMYIGDAARSPAKVSHDIFYTQSILTAGDPQHPTAPGAVLLYDKEIVLATLPGLNETPLTQVPEQLVL
jgi:hypothetical protein